MAELEDSIYDDDAAVRYIQSHIPQEIQGKYEDDEILLITDIIFEYYERNGWFDSDEVIDIDMADVVEYVVKTCKKDPDCHFDCNPEYIYWIVDAEMDYEAESQD